MTRCIKHLDNYDLVKKCCKSRNSSLTSNFQKDKIRNDGLKPNCKICGKELIYLKSKSDKYLSEKL